ncbi:hypothetical protein BDA99DRAFT_505340 [Phascolomyces articulosus]|uniref:Postreplication repair E3 ubiquitin-protein ligase RAD18 n=1 Tax=Phascolomyces articulosus TaxID=60185 RepID=A0AAD5K4B3_9FUNG|nr:hypothetical protein BDA99DRAFT_505340 [Phascolomyces articulosus]
MEDIHDPTDFSDSCLQRLDRELRCAICKDLYATPMQLTTCIHSFCALCIRRRLAQERVCPACKTPADETKMIRNSVLDECVNTWRTAARQLVITLEKSQTQPQTQPQQQQPIKEKRSAPVIASGSSPSLAGIRRSTRIGKQQQQSPYNSVITLDDDDSDFREERPQQQQQPVQPSPPTLQTIPPVDTPSNNSDKITQESQVQCPICSQFMRQVVINEHLDRCMRGDHSIPQPPRQFLGQAASSSSSTVQNSNSSTIPTSSSNTVSPIINRRDSRQNKDLYGKKPVKLVYDMQKEKDLKKTLKDLGLPDHGDKQQMVWRHKEYVTLYYANLDAEHPKEGRALIRQLQEAEEGYTNGRQHSNAQQLNVEEHNRKYKNQFDELIANARKRARVQQQQSSTPSSLNDNTATTNPSPPSSLPLSSLPPPSSSSSSSSSAPTTENK